MGYAAGILPVASISLAGLALTLLYDAMISLSYFFLGIANANTVLFVSTHILFNYFVFFYIAPVLMKILA